MKKLVKESLSQDIVNLGIGSTFTVAVPKIGKWDIEIKDIYYDTLTEDIIFELKYNNTNYKRGGLEIESRKSLKAFKRDILPYIN